MKPIRTRVVKKRVKPWNPLIPKLLIPIQEESFEFPEQMECRSEVRMIDAKPCIAFVEFEDDNQSLIAMEALQGFKITPPNPMAITYAKK
ncbi:hypothetical protein AgCh_038805 [Apium graveolens]